MSGDATLVGAAPSRGSGIVLAACLALFPSCRSQPRAAGPAPGVPAPGPDARVEPVLAERPRPVFDGSIRIASIFPTLGRYALSGIQSHRGARLAVEDVNREGGIHGRPLALLEYGTGSYFVDARHAAELASGEGEAVALVGSNSSSLSKAIAEVAEARRVVQVSNVSTAYDLTWDPVTGKDRPYVFRVCGSDLVSGAILAEFAKDHLHARRVAVLYEVGRTYSAYLARSFVESYQDKATGRLTAEFVYLPLETDFGSQLDEISSFRPDVLFLPASFTDATLIAIQAERRGLRATLLGGDAWSNRLLFKRGGPSRPAYHSDHCFPSEPFQDAYRSRFGEEPDGCRAILAYDAVRALGAALGALGPLTDDDLQAKGLGPTRERARLALSRVKVRGQTGVIRFDEHGDVRRGVAIIEVRPISPARHEPRLRLWLGDR